MTTGCGDSAAKAPEPAAEPMANCVDQAEQRTNGVTLKRADGQAVHGLMYGTGDVGIVFANQVDEDLCSWRFWAQNLATRAAGPRCSTIRRCRPSTT
jgi:hypothetical protein